MSNSSFDEVLNSILVVSDSSKLLKLLIDIRKKVDGDAVKSLEYLGKIRDKGAFKPIVRSLHCSKKTIINVSLSILGNCCLDAKCARDVMCQYGIISSLNHLSKRYPKEDSINGRMFRIVGNICQHPDQWAIKIVEKKSLIVKHIIDVLNDSIDNPVSDATVTMGVRALRELLHHQTLLELISTHHVLQCVGMLLITYGDLWLQNKAKESILVNIIKLLHEYSRFRCYQSIVEMRNTVKGDSIIYLSKILLVSPRQVVKIVMNFLKMSLLKSDLPVRKIFDSFVDILSNDTILQDFNSTCEDCIKCLCHLLEHPGNLENDRCGESIPILIKVLKGLSFDSGRKCECAFLIISTLNKCRYNNSLIMIQNKCDIIGVINEKLHLLVGSTELINGNHTFKKHGKRKCEFFEQFRQNKRRSRLDQFKEESKISSDEDSDQIDLLYSNHIRYDYSPASSNESEMGRSWTSGLSPPNSPRSQICVSESDSDDYSPVCSEADPVEFSEFEDFSNPEGVFFENISEQIENKFDPDALKYLKVKVILEIIELLKTFVRIKQAVPQLGSPVLLLRLIKSTTYFDWPESSIIVTIMDVICRIIGFHENFLQLLLSDFVATVYELGKTPHNVRCSICFHFQWISYSIIRKTSSMSESGWAKGEIAHRMLRGDCTTKQRLVLVIPYIIRNKSILVKLMLNCGGLDILIKLFQTPSELQNKSIKVLCVLAGKKLGIPNPKTISDSMQISSHSTDLPKTCSVTFRLDDDSLITTDRGLLIRASDFFARMLDGDFMESTQDVIALPNVTASALECLISIMEACPIDDNVMLVTLLEMITLCDRFLMEETRTMLTDYVERFKLNHGTVPVIYKWALESRTNLLRVESVAFAMVGAVEDSERFLMFKELFDLDFLEELIEDIRQLLVRYMTLRPINDLTKKKRKRNLISI